MNVVLSMPERNEQHRVQVERRDGDWQIVGIARSADDACQDRRDHIRSDDPNQPCVRLRDREIEASLQTSLARGGIAIWPKRSFPDEGIDAGVAFLV